MKAPTGKELKEVGMTKALDHAGIKWQNFILGKMRNYCKRRKKRGKTEFLTENFRAVAVRRKWPLPPSPNSWGAITIAAKNAGIIKPTNRVRPAQSPKTHGHGIRVWIAL